MTHFEIDHQCPQCGAPAVFKETDRLLQCGYCKVNSYLLQDRYFRYVLPFTPRRHETPIFVPYWRFKGTLYSAAGESVSHRFMDVSYQGVQTPYIPVSLGFRSQVLKLKFATRKTEGRFLRADLPLPQAMEIFKRRFNKSTPSPIYHQDFIGETFCVIFAPYYISDRIIDAVLNEPVSSKLPENFSLENLVRENIDWSIGFVPSICPHCGWDLTGESDSLVLLCKNCDAVWFPKANGLKKIPFSILPGKGVIYLPFWRIEAEVQGLELSSFADLIRVANLPMVTPENAHDRAICFWALAFKVRPRAFLRLNTTITLSQPPAERSSRLPDAPIFPVTLPATEAVQSLKITFANFSRPTNHYFPLLPSINIKPKKVHLVYIPFEETPQEFIQERFSLTVNKNQLKLSSNL